MWTVALATPLNAIHRTILLMTFMSMAHTILLLLISVKPEALRKLLIQPELELILHLLLFLFSLLLPLLLAESKHRLLLVKGCDEVVLILYALAFKRLLT